MSSQAPDFLEELDLAISNVGTNQVWKRKIGDMEIWISPITVTGQDKVNDAITKTDLGAGVVSEGKKVTLSHAIVGINDFDLTDYRDGSPVFPVKGRDGKPAKVSLDKYLYNKMASWSAHLIDDVFAVYADLMETFQKENVKDIKFENAKHPIQELAELEARASELRAQLGMKPLVEQGSEASVSDKAQESSTSDLDEDAPLDRRAQETKEEPVEFNPFDRAPVPSRTSAGVSDQLMGQMASNPGPAVSVPPVQAPVIEFHTNAAVPVPAPPSRPPPVIKIDLPPGKELYHSNPSVPNEVMSQKAMQHKNIQRPTIDQVPKNVNPRFARPGK